MNSRSNKIGLYIMLVIAFVLFNWLSKQTKLPDYMADAVNNGIKADYYYNVKADAINKAYKKFIVYGWDSFYILPDLPEKEISNEINVLNDYYFVDYGITARHRTRFFQNRTGAEIPQERYCMNYCQENEICEWQEETVAEKSGIKYTVQLLDFYDKNSKEYIKTVCYIKWQQDNSSFLIESDYMFDELIEYIGNITDVKVKAD